MALTIESAKVGFEFECLIPKTADSETVARSDIRRKIHRKIVETGLWNRGAGGYDTEYKHYYITSDSSLHNMPWDLLFRRGRAGIDFEIVSPIMSWEDHTRQFNGIASIVKDMGGYTNSSTGCHWGMSFPKPIMQQLTYLLPLFFYNWRATGREFREQRRWGRVGNGYARSVKKYMGNMHSIIGGDRMPFYFKHHSGAGLIREVNKSLAISLGKFVTVNPHFSGRDYLDYLEVRVPGGRNYQNKIHKVDQTLIAVTKTISETLELKNVDAYQEAFAFHKPKDYTYFEEQMKAAFISNMNDYLAKRTPIIV